MKLADYIEKIGRAEAARKFNVSLGAISHWVTGRRKPSARKALEIVRVSPVTWDGIYDQDRPRA